MMTTAPRRRSTPTAARRVQRIALVVCIAALAAIGTTAVAAPAPRPGAVPDCLGKLKVKPREIVFACADGNFGVRGLHWIGWGEPTAAATGSAYANDCTPNCAGGHFHTYRAVIVVTGSERCAGGRYAYRKATIAFVGASPYAKATAADLTYPFRCT